MIEALLPPLQRGLLFGAVLLLVGVVAWRSWIFPRIQPPAPGEEAREGTIELEHQAVRVGLLASLFLLGVWALRLLAQLQDFRDPFVPVSEDVAFLVRETTWGRVWMVQGAVVVFLIVVFAIVLRTLHAGTEVERRRASGGSELGRLWQGAWAGCIALVLTLALSSHAMSVPYNRPLAVAVDSAHTLAAGAWMGTLAFIVARPLGRDPASSRLQAQQLQAFSPLAMASVSVLVFMGVVLAGAHLGQVGDLWETRYGRVLSLKVVVAGVAMVLGGVNWRWGLPGMGAEGGVRAVHRRAMAEVGVAALVLALTAVLTGTPPPGGH